MLGHFSPFYPLKNPKMKILKNGKIDLIILHMRTKNHNDNDVWLLRYGVWQTEFFCHYGAFFALLLAYKPKKSKFEKMKKTLEDIIILQMFTVNDSHMVYGFSDMECNRRNFFVILDRFSPFYPLTTQKNQNIEKMKKTWRYHHFTQVYQKSWFYAILFLRNGM